MDHDQRFKTLLREFFGEFFELFFPLWAARFDFSAVEWLEQEIFPDPPEGERQAVDLVARVPLRQPVQFSGAETVESMIALVHVEIEAGETVVPIRRRVFRYHFHLEDKFQLPVLPIVLFLKVGKDGIGWDRFEKHFWERCLLQFHYPYIGLPALDAEEYLHGDNWLGIALTALMRVPPERRLTLGAEAWTRLIQYPENTYKRYLLCECVNAYTAVDEAQQDQFKHLLVSSPDPGVQSMTMTMFEKIEHEGRLKGQREVLEMQVLRKFGSLPADVKQRIAALSDEPLKEKLLAVVTAQSLQELGLAD